MPIAYLKPTLINELGGVIDPANITLAQRLRSYSNELRIEYDDSNENTKGSPTAATYIKREAASGRIVTAYNNISITTQTPSWSRSKYGSGCVLDINPTKRISDLTLNGGSPNLITQLNSVSKTPNIGTPILNHKARLYSSSSIYGIDFNHNSVIGPDSYVLNSTITLNGSCLIGWCDAAASDAASTSQTIFSSPTNANQGVIGFTQILGPCIAINDEAGDALAFETTIDGASHTRVVIRNNDTYMYYEDGVKRYTSAGAPNTETNGLPLSPIVLGTIGQDTSANGFSPFIGVLYGAFIVSEPSSYSFTQKDVTNIHNYLKVR